MGRTKPDEAPVATTVLTMFAILQLLLALFLLLSVVFTVESEEL